MEVLGASWHVPCFITGMIAASHIATTASVNDASSAKSNTHRDPVEQSFSDSLGAAKQHAAANIPVAHDSHRNASSPKNSDSEKTAKRVKREQATSGIDTSRMQQVEESVSTPRTWTVPTDLQAVAGKNQEGFDSAMSSEQPQQSVSAVNTLMQGPASWMNLGGNATWNQHSLIASPSDVSSPASDVIFPAKNEDDADDAAINVADAAQPQADVQSASAAAPAQPVADVSSLLPTAEHVDSTTAVNSAAAAASQVSANAAQSVGVSNKPQPSTPAGLNVSALSAGKAGNVFKSLQALKPSPKDPVLSTSLPAGAKETDSYLSIQKEAKDSDGTTKDASALPTAQHADHSQAAQQSFVTPTAGPVQATPVLPAHAHQEPASFNLNDASTSSQQQPVQASLSSQLQQAVATTPASSEHLSTVVNSAKLIQSIGQSEMRVGMRTAEFGDISIRTSSGRDSISAQISLGHEDLAKALTAHMPEMQTRLTTGEVVDVHIQNEGQSASFDGGHSSGNNGGSHAQQQDGSSARASTYVSYSAERSTFAASPAMMAASAGSSSSRLDIRA